MIQSHQNVFVIKCGVIPCWCTVNRRHKEVRVQNAEYNSAKETCVNVTDFLFLIQIN